jgi:SOS regulatory protein LexA
VAGEEQPREQSWQTMFRLVHSVLVHQGATVALALFQAISEACQTVSNCHDQLSMLGPQPLEESTFNDWQQFLFLLYKETSDLYVTRASTIPERSFQARFESIESAARGTLLQLQDLNSKKPPARKDREDMLEEFMKLLHILQATRNELGKLRAVQEANEARVDVISQEPAYVPLVGRIAAGVPILAVEAVEDIFPLPRRVVGEGTLFVLEVFGDSMIDAAITDGDWVVIRQQRVAENGEIVAAILAGEVTIKTFSRGTDGHVWLIPQNEAYDRILGDHATILGKVVAVLRRA